MKREAAKSINLHIRVNIDVLDCLKGNSYRERNPVAVIVFVFLFPSDYSSMTDSTSFALTMATQQRHTAGRRGGITYINTHNGKKKNKKKKKKRRKK